MQTIPGVGTLMEALEKIPTVVTHAFSLNLTAEYSDIVLPITTQWERMSDYFLPRLGLPGVAAVPGPDHRTAVRSLVRRPDWL